jgi:hypothetical protein
MDGRIKARFADEQIIAMIKEKEAGKKFADVCWRHGISSAASNKYKSKNGGMEGHIFNTKGSAQSWRKLGVQVITGPLGRDHPSIRQQLLCQGSTNFPDRDWSSPSRDQSSSS